MPNFHMARVGEPLAEPASIQKRAYEQHRLRVKEAVPTVDMVAPPSRPHVLHDAKRLQIQRERQAVITRDNFILLKNLREIMHRRVNKDGNVLAKQKSTCIRTR